MSPLRTIPVWLAIAAWSNAAPPGEVWTNRLEVAPRAAMAAATCAWTTQVLRVQIVHSDSILELDLRSGRTSWRNASPQALAPELADRVQTFPFPAPTTNVVWLTFKRQPRAWWVYIDDCPAARLPELGTNSVILRHSPAALPPAAARDEYVQRTAAFRVDDSFMVPVSNQLAETWERRSGDWSLHTVTGTSLDGVAPARLSRYPTPQRSPNFYSLDGRGNPAVILTGEDFHDRYTVRASVQHNSGTNGLIFLAGERGAYGYTARTDPATERLALELWRGNPGSLASRQILGAVQTELLPGQWLLLEARVFDDRVVCLADNIEVMRLPLPLPPSGRYGLLAHTREGTRFDDFSAATHDDYPFDLADDMRLNTLATEGGFQARAPSRSARFPAWSKTNLSEPCFFESPGSPQPRIKRFGSTADAPHLLDVTFMPTDRSPYTCGLLAGWRSPSEPGYRFTCRVAAGTRYFTLEQLSPTGTVACASMSLPAPVGDRRVRLTLDALRPNELRAGADGRLVLLLRPGEPVAGAGGIMLAGRETVRHSPPLYTTRAPLFCDRFEKNLQYVNDPFMRHWASPEGQWVQQRDGSATLRGDMIGSVRVRLPVIAPSTLYLAVDESGSNAACRVECTNNLLSAFVPGAGTQAVWSVSVASIPAVAVEGQQPVRLFTVGLEDHVLWLGTDQTLLAQTHLPRIPRGRGVRLLGFDLNALRQTLVRRENVFDTLFNESLCNWTLNGGTWEVVNRFQCEPTWSHMNGQNDRSLAALWSKYDFAGDFCVEFFAGMRMGWYERAGDLNLTVMSRAPSPGDGYTVTTTGWDPDHSQLFTRLWRNGQVLAVSTNYLVPRIRSGNVRLAGYEPLVPGGRDMHGAWYGLRFRRVDNRLTYLFDNAPVFDWIDPAPLQNGALGIWTYRNSMMVARVRIVAESVSPHRFAFARIDPAAAPGHAPAASPARPGPRLQAGDWPAEPLTADWWEADDPVSQPLVSIGDDPGESPVLRATAQQGGGSFMVRASLPHVSAERWLGWRFELARSPEALVNFEFSTGTSSGPTNFTLVQPWSFVLSGSPETRGVRRVIGSSACPPTPRGAARPVWTPVEVWLPSEVLSGKGVVRVDGFGNLQPSDVQQGLLGNPPGAWFAVRRLRPVHRGLPDLSGDGPRQARESLAAAMAGLAPGSLQRVRVPAELDAYQPEIEWAVPPDANFGIEASLDPCLGDILRVGPTALWNSPLLPPTQVLLNGQPVGYYQQGRDLRVLLPRPLPDTTAATLAVDLADGRTFRQSVKLDTPQATNRPPVLVRVDMPEGGLTTFETRPPVTNLTLFGPLVVPIYDDPVQGTCLQVQNQGELRRLNMRLLTIFDPIVTPLLQFRYRGDPMARVSLALSQEQLVVAFSENIGIPVSLGAPVALDNAWHTWLCMPVRASDTFPVQRGFAFSAGEVRVSSRHPRDQTGRYSALAIDDIACGPAAGPSRVLAFRSSYIDADGVEEVLYALSAGSAPWDALSAADRQALRWQAVTNFAVVTPDLAPLSEGIHHVVLKARDKRGAWSPVSDIPFMLDRTPPTIAHAVRETQGFNGTCLDITLNGGVAMPVLRNLTVACDNLPLSLNGDYGKVTTTASVVRLELDWPKLIRRQLNGASDGKILRMSFDGIVDQAGNILPRYEIPFRVDYASDRNPPTTQILPACTNILAWQPVCRTPTEFFNQLQVQEAVAQTSNGIAFIEYTPLAGESASSLGRAFPEVWSPDRHPWLALSLKLGSQAGYNTNLVLRFVTHNLPKEARRQGKDDSTYVLSLPAAPGANPFVQGQTRWQAGEWQDMLIQVGGFLRDATGLSNAPPVRAVVLQLPPGGKQKLQVRAAAVLAPWGADDVLKFRAYDMSGVRGLTWQGDAASANLGIRPSRLKLPANDATFIKIRVVDKAGNPSDCFFVPLPPGPSGGNLPLEVPFDD